MQTERLRGARFPKTAAEGRRRPPGTGRTARRASLEEFGASPHGYHFHLLIRRLLEGDPSLLAGSGWHGPAEDLPQRMAEFLFGTCRDRILVTEEIGSGDYSPGSPGAALPGDGGAGLLPPGPGCGSGVAGLLRHRTEDQMSGLDVRDVEMERLGPPCGLSPGLGHRGSGVAAPTRYGSWAG